MSALTYPFISDPTRNEGVRPFNIWGLRLFYGLMFFMAAPSAWEELLTHQGPWDALQAVAWCVWAAYPTMSFLGLFKPLKMLPIMLFMIFYKATWLAVVAYPLWSTGQLAGSPVEEMAYMFAGISVPILIVPWGYAARTYLPWWPQKSNLVAQSA